MKCIGGAVFLLGLSRPVSSFCKSFLLSDWVRDLGPVGQFRTNRKGNTWNRFRPESQGDQHCVGPRDKGVRLLSYQELAERKRKCLCYKCGGPFHPNQQCPDQQMRVMLVEDEDEEEGEANAMVEAKHQDGECSMLFLGTTMVVNEQKPQTLKVRAHINGVHVLVLVNSGATHNFISRKLVSTMALASC